MDKKRILVVDDEQGFTRLLKMALSGYEIREVNDPSLALDVAREFRPDLMLLDVVMPDLDGGDLATQLQAEPTLANVPIIFVTAIVSPKEGESERTIGGFPFIAKPVARDTLIRCIEAHLATAAARAS
ncbi:MAG: two-component system, OmpR family, response regulator [Chthoniobacter sp.]|jgi:CheY-like chemotaxis protein|nr:two-component system, OmpR family, response regulator [Chthoniobacter sp.]